MGQTQQKQNPNEINKSLFYQSEQAFNYEYKPMRATSQQYYAKLNQRKTEEHQHEGNENIDGMSESSYPILLPKDSEVNSRNSKPLAQIIKELQMEEKKNDTLSYTDTMNGSVKFGNNYSNYQSLQIYSQDKYNINEVDDTKLISLISDGTMEEQSSSFSHIQLCLLKISQRIKPHFLKSLNFNTLDQVLNLFTFIIDQEYQSKKQNIDITEYDFQTFILDQLTIYKSILFEMVEELQDTMKLSLIKKLDLYQLKRTDTITSLLSDIQQENYPQLIKHISIQELQGYINQEQGINEKLTQVTLDEMKRIERSEKYYEVQPSQSTRNESQITSVSNTKKPPDHQEAILQEENLNFQSDLFLTKSQQLRTEILKIIGNKK